MYVRVHKGGSRLAMNTQRAAVSFHAERDVGSVKIPFTLPLGQDFQPSRFLPSPLLLSIKASPPLADFLKEQTPQTLSMIYSKYLKEADASGISDIKDKNSLKQK